MSLAATLHNDSRVANPRNQGNIEGSFDRNKLNYARYGALNYHLAENALNNGIVSQELIAKVAAAQSINVQVPVMDRNVNIALSAVRRLVIPAAENDTRLLTLTAVTITFGFHVYPAQHFNNDFGMQADFDNKFESGLILLLENLENLSIANLLSVRSQAFNWIGQHTLNGGIIEATAADQDRILGDVSIIMNSNDFNGDVHIIGDPGTFSALNQIEKFGQYNSQNNAVEWQDKIFHFSRFLTPAGTQRATFIAANPGNFGVVVRQEPEAIMGTRTGDGHAWDIIDMPKLGLPMTRYTYDGVGDFTGLGAHTPRLERGRMLAYDYAADFFFATADNTNLATNPNPVFQGAILN